MKYRKETRQITALANAMRHAKGYEAILKGSPSEQAEMLANVISDPKKVDNMTKEEVKASLEDKLTKTLVCIENLNAKGIGNNKK